MTRVKLARHSITWPCWWMHSNSRIQEWPADGRPSEPRTQTEQQRWQAAARHITKQGDAYLRTLLFQGARSAVLTAHRRDDRLSRWIVGLRARVGFNMGRAGCSSENPELLALLMVAYYDPSYARSTKRVYQSLTMRRALI